MSSEDGGQYHVNLSLDICDNEGDFLDHSDDDQVAVFDDYEEAHAFMLHVLKIAKAERDKFVYHPPGSNRPAQEDSEPDELHAGPIATGYATRNYVTPVSSGG